MEEKFIYGFPDYTITENMEITNIKTNKKVKIHILKIYKNKKYYSTTLYKNKKRYTVRVHRLIFETFKHPIPKGYVIDHIDNNGLNNSLANLRLCTLGENLRYQNKQNNNITGYSNINVAKDRNKKFKLVINCKTIAYFYTLEEAVKKRDEVLLSLES